MCNTLEDLLRLIDEAKQMDGYVKENNWFEIMLSSAVIKKRNNIIIIEQRINKSIDKRQLKQKIEQGYWVYAYITHYDDIILYYYKNKIDAFNKFRGLNMDSLVYEKALIDTERGIIVKNIERLRYGF